MTTRYWKAKWNMGLVGTDMEEDIDLLDYYDTIDKVEALSDENAQEFVTQIAFEEATSMIDAFAEKNDEYD